MEGPSSMVRVDTLRNLQNLAKEGDVEALFSILEEDPNVLERIDQVPFVTTPLHTAAREGKFHFAKEILNLMPSFASKRDHLGRSPLHLALEGKHLQKGLNPCDPDLELQYQKIVSWLIKHPSELVRVKAKGMATPLHYAAELDDESSLDEFLHVCPSSIEDLTVKSETAIHVAIKNKNLNAFKVLLGWLRYFNKKEMLHSKDDEGNNALHTAVSANQPEVVKLLIGCMKVNIENSNGLTALDMAQGVENAAVRNILLTAKAKTASEPHPPLRGSEKTLKFKKFSDGLSCSDRIGRKLRRCFPDLNKVPIEVRNMLLVFAILTATATYQAALAPPGGYWQDDGKLQPAANNTGISNTTTSAISNTNTTTAISNTTTTAISNTTTTISSTEPSEQHLAGNMILAGSRSQLIFLICNSLAFSTSVCLISILLTGLPFRGIILTLIFFMVVSYHTSILETCRITNSASTRKFFAFFIFESTYFACYFSSFILTFYRDVNVGK
ncbi:ankyrin repeat-containing protein BDA1-like [Mangifera indica]|uniref:ankyrin repeat-containing protein BDA1-like n=1 Tax=Mangifera indica TaxID=29780 RepID=UPI001CFBE4DA|nr:ankyrin repeat-containing protein BDA1-like [Mangifera indica]